MQSLLSKVIEKLNTNARVFVVVCCCCFLK